MYGHVFSPFHRNTLLTDARRLHVSDFGERSGLLGLFYIHTDGDPKQLTAAGAIHGGGHRRESRAGHRPLVRSEASACRIPEFSGLQDAVHGQFAVISLIVE